MFLFRLSACLLALCSYTLAASLLPRSNDATDGLSSQPSGGLVARTLKQIKSSFNLKLDLPVPKLGCLFSSHSRYCWKDHYNVLTDFDEDFPDESNVVEYHLEITNITLAPDGFERLVLAVNGQYPGPVLQADWGDTMVVHVKNSMQDNGTSIHFHGLRQLNTNGYDGVNGLTECPIAAGDSRTYRFKCSQYGTSWYHSHFTAQYGDGVVGAIVIRGPANEDYDVDLGSYMLTDWYHTPVGTLNWRSIHSNLGTGPPTADNGLINGTMVNPDGPGGSYNRINVERGRRYLLRVINSGVNDFMHFSIDNHIMTVISADFIPITPFDTSYISLGVGQRYNVIFEANQDGDDFWIRYDPDRTCTRNRNAGNIKAILSYGGGGGEPNTQRHDDIPEGCNDMPNLVPRVANQVPQDGLLESIRSLELDAGVVQTNDGQLFHWYLDGTAMRIDWGRPTMQYVIDGDFNFPREINLIELPQKDRWYYFVIQEAPELNITVPHPIHLHGHDFYLLGVGTGQWDRSLDGLQFDNPIRRDTAMLPGLGYMIIAFPADNPGAWLMHCHIAWHVGQGFSLQFLEQRDRVLSTLGDRGEYERVCDGWRDYYRNPVYRQEDSGL
ncbi:laccase [Phyllosticta citribraziliensis]|uniref:Laccase n=1 Tax=Phyllosticta citribraziliensis TaxID=989973 RepID=A0ABR1LQA3_9PEZI